MRWRALAAGGLLTTACLGVCVGGSAAPLPLSPSQRVGAAPRFLAAMGSQTSLRKLGVTATRVETLAAGCRAGAWLDEQPRSSRDVMVVRRRYDLWLRARGVAASAETGINGPGWIAREAWRVFC